LGYNGVSPCTRAGVNKRRRRNGWFSQVSSLRHTQEVLAPRFYGKTGLIGKGSKMHWPHYGTLVTHDNTFILKPPLFRAAVYPRFANMIGLLG
jgi:hypothetical protein